MTEITTLVGTADTLWDLIAALAVLVIGFLAGRKLFRKI